MFANMNKKAPFDLPGGPNTISLHEKKSCKSNSKSLFLVTL